MTDISQIEERLFLLLDTVEKQAEQNDQLQQKILQLTKKLDSKSDNFNKEIEDKLSDAENKINVTQKRFDNIVYLSAKHVIEQNLPELLENVIRENADFKPIETALDDAVQSLNQQINGNSSIYKSIQKHNLQEIKEISNGLEHLKQSVMKEHYKILAITSASIFIIFFLFFWIMYAINVPTQEKLESLKQEKIQLMSDINYLKNIRTEWEKDARKNGYLKR